MKESRKLRNEELGRMNIPSFKKVQKIPVIIILDNIRSQHNTGSVFRTADAFLIEKIYLCGITATPPHREIHKTALGAEDSVEWKYTATVEEAVAEVRAAGYRVCAVEQTENAVPLDKFELEFSRKYAFIFGNEVKGVNQKAVDMSDICVEIPQYGTKHSLNVSVCAGIVLWQTALPLLKPQE